MKFALISAGVLAACIIGVGQYADASTWVATCPGSGTTTLTHNPTTINPLSGGTSVSFAADTAGGSDSGTTGSGTTAGAPDALGALLGTPGQSTEAFVASNFSGATLASGDLIVINGMCVQDIEVRTSGITIAGFNANFSADFTPLASPPDAATIGNNGVQGNFIIDGASHVTINEVLLGSTSGTITLNTNNSLDNTALLFLTGSQLFIINSLIQGSPTRGVFISSNSTATIESDTITENGTGQTNHRENMGIQANDASSILLGDPVTGDFPVTVSNNAGDGVDATRSSAISISGATITGNGQSQVLASGASSLRIEGNNSGTTTITALAGNTEAAVEAQGGSSILIEGGVTVQGGTAAGSTAISLLGNSLLLLQGSTISGGFTTIEVTGAGSVFLAGGNLICNGSVSSSVCSPAGGTVIDLEHVAALIDVAGLLADSDYPLVGDALFGAATVQLQSSVDLGTGDLTSAPSITWTTGSNGIVVAQNSSFRLQGGVQINGAITLSQGSNGFFNKTKGGTNNVTGGVACPFTSIPSSHVVGPSAVSTTPALTLSGSITSTSAKQCLSF